MTARAVLIRGGVVFDGAASSGATNDVLLEAGRIIDIAPRLDCPGARQIDASGTWVVPGFIDAHSHCDLAALSGHEMERRARAGVTTEIVGQDGLGFAPADGRAATTMTEILSPIVGELPPTEWASIAAYLGDVDRGAFARIATLVPHGAMRAQVAGREARTLSESERAELAALVRDGVSGGALGMSVGLSYPPALWSDTDELVGATRAMPANYQYVTHLRDYGRGFDEALDEALIIGRRAGRPVHLSHFHVSGAGRSGTARSYLSKLSAATAQGASVTWDSYPYTSACTFLGTVLPAELHTLGSAGLRDHLRSEDQALTVASQLDIAGPGASVAVGWEGLILSGLRNSEMASLDGLTIDAAASANDTTPGRVVVEIFRRLGWRACVVVTQGHMDNVVEIAQSPAQVVGSDGIMGCGVPHPRAAGTHLRFLRWARDGVVGVSVSEMVAKMTSRTARLFDLDVGRIAPGFKADVLVIDPDALEDGPDIGDYTPDAVRYSLLGGHFVIDDGRWQAPKLPGLALRRARSRRSASRPAPERRPRS